MIASSTSGFPDSATRSSSDPSSGRCSGRNRTVYLRTEGVRMDSAQSLQTFTGLSLYECADKCTKWGEAEEEGQRSESEPKVCRSFEYDSEELVCTMKAVDSQPFGRGMLSMSSKVGIAEHRQQTVGYPTLAHFQSICLPIEHYPFCPSAHLFERFPQRILVGHALEIHSVTSLSDCLANCLEAKQKFLLDCHSVMYFYESGICVLNREGRRNVGEEMFREEKDGNEMVDYFENVCADVECPQSSELHWIRTEHFRIDPSREVLLEQKEFQIEKCRQLCEENRLFGSPFPCKAFMHSASSGQCQLSAESAIRRDPIGGAKKERERRRPFEGANSGEENSMARMGQELSTFSTGQYHEKVCLPADSEGGQTVTVPNCKESASFELFPGRALNVNAVGNGGERVFVTKTVAHCLKACLVSATYCRSVQFRRDRDECLLSPLSQLSHPELFHLAPSVDYFDHLCPPSNNYSNDLADALFFSTPLPTIEEALSIGEKSKRAKPEMEEIGMEGEKIVEIGESGTETKTEERGAEEARMEVHRAVIETECRLRGIQIRVRFPSLSSGSLFLRDHSSNCRVTFHRALISVLLLPFLPPNGANGTEEAVGCPGTQLGPNLWSFVVVLQQNEQIDKPMPTGQERVFNVTCDFNNILKRNNPNQRNDFLMAPQHQQQILADSAPSLPDLSPPLPPNLRLRMALLRDGLPVNAVKLGEELELRWTFEDEKDRKELGMLVEHCVAERMDGVPPDPPPLALIEHGCPEPKMLSAHLIGHAVLPRTAEGGGFNTSLRVFRFDGSRRVRIRCAVNICVERCEPVNCRDQEGDGTDRKSDPDQISYERRKRNGNSVGVTTLGELAEMVEKYDRMRTETKPKQERRKTNGPKVQQSTTISGSYTIMDNDKEEGQHGEDERNGLKRVKVMLGGKRRDEEDGRDQSEEEQDEEEADEEGEEGDKKELIRLVGGKGTDREEGDRQRQMIPVVLTEKKKKTNGEKEEADQPQSRKRMKNGAGGGRAGGGTMAECAEKADGSSSSSSPSSLCISRPFAVFVFLFLLILTVIQCFQIFRHLRKKSSEKHSENPPEETEQHPPAPISASISALDHSSVECGFHGVWHKTNALCAQEQCRHCCWNGTEGANAHRQHSRPVSHLSWADGDEIVEGRFRHQRQTVFPAEPNQRRRVMEPV